MYAHVAVNLAASLASRGLEVGLLDVDVHGPSVPGLECRTRARTEAGPRCGCGMQCAQMAAWAAGKGVTTHVIETDTRGVKHLPEIAAAGGGRCVSLSNRGGDSLIIEIAGLTFGERFEDALREFFRTYLELCR